MRTKAHKFEAVVIRLAVDENEIRPDVAAPVIVPFRRTVGDRNAARQQRVGGEQVDDLHQQGIQASCCAGRIFLSCSHAESGWCI